MKTTLDEITVSPDGNCTVFGQHAHRLWAYGRGDFPRSQQGKNRFFVLELTEPERGDRWIMRAAQTSREGAERYMTAPGHVLVEVQ